MTHPSPRPLATLTFILAALLLLPGAALAHDPPFTSQFDRDRCTFTSGGESLYFPLWPGYALLLEGEEEDEGETIEISVLVSVLTDTEFVDGVETRVVEERETEDGELVEVSRNFFALCRETGDLWYFGEDVQDIEDGEVVGSEGAWRAGVDGAEPGILMMGQPLVGARFFTEMAPGVAEDRTEILAVDETAEVTLGTFAEVVRALDTDVLEPEDEGDVKLYARGIGLIRDEDAELVDIELPPCLPTDTTLCLQDGRFRVEVEFEPEGGAEGEGRVSQVSNDSGEVWFFTPDNVELLIKVLDACSLPEFETFWFFAAGLTNVEVEITVTDTESGLSQTYDNPQGNPFDPVLDTSTFDVCP